MLCINIIGACTEDINSIMATSVNKWSPLSHAWPYLASLPPPSLVLGGPPTLHESVAVVHTLKRDQVRYVTLRETWQFNYSALLSGYTHRWRAVKDVHI